MVLCIRPLSLTFRVIYPLYRQKELQGERAHEPREALGASPPVLPGRRPAQLSNDREGLLGGCRHPHVEPRISARFCFADTWLRRSHAIGHPGCLTHVSLVWPTASQKSDGCCQASFDTGNPSSALPISFVEHAGTRGRVESAGWVRSGSQCRCALGTAMAGSLSSTGSTPLCAPAQKL